MALHMASVESSCHLRWQEIWLRPVDRAETASKSPESSPSKQDQLEVLSAFTSRQNDPDAEIRYVCQATELTSGGTPMRMADPSHFARDLLTGNAEAEVTLHRPRNRGLQPGSA